MALREQGELDEALQYLRRVASSDPNNAGHHYDLGQALRQSGDLAGAAGAFERALEIDPELREGYYALGTTLKQQSTSARKPRGATSPADDLYARAVEATGRGDLKSVQGQLTEALRLDDNHAGAHNLLGFVLGQQGDLPSALAHLKRAIALQPDSAEARYNLGVALWYSGAREQAIPELREGVKLDPAAGATHAFLGMALREQGDLGGARLSLQRAIALMPPTAAVYVDLGITFLRAGEPVKALGQLEAGLNVPQPSFPTPDWDAAITGLRTWTKAVGPAFATGSGAAGASAEAHNTLGRMLGRTGAPSADVAAAFREAIRLRPDFAEAHNHLGLVLIQAGDDDAGIASLREAVRNGPDYAEARANLGAALTPTNADEAIRELEKAVSLAPASVTARFNLAVAYGASGTAGYAKEIEQLRKVIEIAPAFARAHLALGKALLRDGKVSDAVSALQEASRLDSNSGEARYQLGLALARAGRGEEAKVELQKGRDLVAADDRNQRAALDIAEGRAALEKGDLEQAATKFRRAIELRPDSAEARRYLAQVLEKKPESGVRLPPSRDALRRTAEALAEAGQPDHGSPEGGVRLQPDHGGLAASSASVDDSSRISELEAFVRDGRFKEVEPLLAEYVKQRPSSSWGWYALGYSLFGQQKIGESIKALAKSLELDIRNAEAHKMLGRNLMIIGRFDAAQIEFEQAIRYKPDSAESHYNLGRLFSIQDNWEPARKAFESAVRIDPSYVEALDGLGFALEALGEDAGAIAKYEKAIELNAARGGSFSSAHVNLSAYYNRTGDSDKALEQARKAIALDPKSDGAWFQKGRADERLGSLDAAVDALNRAIAINPRASSYYYVLASVYRRLGWPDESRKALEMFKRLEQESTELEKKRRSSATAGTPPLADKKRDQR